MIEPFLFGIVLGMIPVTLAGLFVAAYLQYRRGKTLVQINKDNFIFYTYDQSYKIKLKY